MIIQKAGVLKYLRYLGIFCAITMGFFSIVATSEDDAKDALGIDDSFSKSADVELPEINVTKTSEAAAAANPETGQTTVQAAIDEANIEGLDEVDIDSVTLNDMEIEYRDTNWKPDTMESITCVLDIKEVNPPATRDAYDATFAGILINEINPNAASIPVSLTTEQARAWNYYIKKDNWDKPFNYTLLCDDDGGAITDFDITLNVVLGITIDGTIF
jgi:hypothetical protein